VEAVVDMQNLNCKRLVVINGIRIVKELVDKEHGSSLDIFTGFSLKLIINPCYPRIRARMRHYKDHSKKNLSPN
jgi:hypothetical protein